MDATRLRNRAFLAFIAPARARAAHPVTVWLIAVAIFFLGSLLGVSAIFAVGSAPDPGASDAEFTQVLFRYMPLTGAVFVMTVFFAVRLIHGVGPAALLGSERSRFWRGAALGGVGAAVSLLPGLLWWTQEPGGLPAISTLSTESLLFLLGGVLMVAPSAMAEELLFRGYLLQQLAAHHLSMVVWAAIPSLVFGLIHYDPALGFAEQWVYLFSTAVFGAVCCYATWRTGSLGYAVGFHVVNNWIAFYVLAPELSIESIAAVFAEPYESALIDLVFAPLYIIAVALTLETARAQRWLDLPRLSD